MNIFNLGSISLIRSLDLFVCVWVAVNLYPAAPRGARLASPQICQHCHHRSRFCHTFAHFCSANIFGIKTRPRCNFSMFFNLSRLNKYVFFLNIKHCINLSSISSTDNNHLPCPANQKIHFLTQKRKNWQHHAWRNFNTKKLMRPVLMILDF